MSEPSSGRTDHEVIDFACHHYPLSIVSEAQTQSPAWKLLAPMTHDLDALEARMDAAGVDRAVLSMSGVEGDDDAAVVAEANDTYFEEISGNDRFFCTAVLPVGAGGEAAAAEFERCLDLGFNGVSVRTRNHGIEPHHDAFEPIYEVADRTGAPVFVHPELNDSLAPGALDDTYFHNAIWGREAALATTISNVIHEGVLDRYPDLNLVVHHMGGNVGSMLGRVEVHGDSGRWPFKEGLVPHEEFRRGLERIYVDTAGHLDHRPAMAAAFDAFPASNVLFGTDTPWEARSADDIRNYIAAVEDVAPPEAHADVFAGNTLDLLVNVE